MIDFNPSPAPSAADEPKLSRRKPRRVAWTVSLGVAVAVAAGAGY